MSYRILLFVPKLLKIVNVLVVECTVKLFLEIYQRVRPHLRNVMLSKPPKEVDFSIDLNYTWSPKL